MSLGILETAAAANVRFIDDVVLTRPLGRRDGVRRRCRFWHCRHIDVLSAGGRCAGAVLRRQGHVYQCCRN